MATLASINESGLECALGAQPGMKLTYGLFNPRGSAPRDVRSSGGPSLLTLLSVSAPGSNLAQRPFQMAWRAGNRVRPAAPPLFKLQPAPLMRIGPAPAHPGRRLQRGEARVAFRAEARLPRPGLTVSSTFPADAAAAEGRASEGPWEGPFEVSMAGDGPLIRVDIATPKPSLAEAGFFDPKIALYDRPSSSRSGAGLLGLPPRRPVFPVSGAEVACGGVRIAERMPGGIERPAEPGAVLEVAVCPHSAPVTLPEMPAPVLETALAPASRWIAPEPEPAELSTPPAPAVYPAVRMRDPEIGPEARRLGLGREAWLASETRILAASDLRVENSDILVQPRVHIRLPGPASAQESPAVAPGQYVRSEWRIASLTGARPLEVLAKGEGLAACAYRTRSML